MKFYTPEIPDIAHAPVLLKEVIEYLSPRSPNIYVDGTLGGGGHAEKILEQSSPGGTLIGIDLDPYMLKEAENRLKNYQGRCRFVHGNFSDIGIILKKLGIKNVNGILLDLGVAIHHFKLYYRGFSLKKEGPLDMRLDPEKKLTAEFIVNQWSREDITRILDEFGEERFAKKIAGAIVDRRKEKKICTTTELAEIVNRAVGRTRKFTKISEYKVHPATKTFQALRIAVNNELKNIKEVVPAAVNILIPGGRLCVITFHSLEDRIVKDEFKELAFPCKCPKELPACVCGRKPSVKIITKKPVVPEKEELEKNPYSRSAKLRVVEKI